MNGKLRLACIVLACILIAGCIAMIALEIVLPAPKGDPGKQGQQGHPQPLVPSVPSSFPSTTSDGTFHGDFVGYYNAQKRLFTLSTLLTALAPKTLNPGDALPLLNLTSNIPPFASGALGTIISTLSSTNTHFAVYTAGAFPNVSFVAGSSLVLAPNDQFTLNLSFGSV